MMNNPIFGMTPDVKNVKFARMNVEGAEIELNILEATQLPVNKVTMYIKSDPDTLSDLPSLFVEMSRTMETPND